MERQMNGVISHEHQILISDLMQQENGSAAVGDSVFQNGSSEKIHGEESFIHQAMEIIIDEAVKKATNVNEKVCEWHSPEQLKELLDLELKDEGESESKILQRCKDAIRY
ncbi:acidic amino acid decarboxylase GADL1, partial [Nematolebias whitei]|uniref:acidic amino acid decarboxylase GADL1 n=1 Tax=Nematolebias whitei TaxID=451745 RepID=UPI00189C334F